MKRVLGFSRVSYLLVMAAEFITSSNLFLVCCQDELYQWIGRKKVLMRKSTILRNFFCYDDLSSRKIVLHVRSHIMSLKSRQAWICSLEKVWFFMWTPIHGGLQVVDKCLAKIST